MTDPESLSGQLLDQVQASGELAPQWREAFAAVPRHRFIPDTIWITDRAGLMPLERGTDPAGWLQHAYSPAAVITQVDDGCSVESGRRGRYITSSASQPSVVARMLAALDAESGMRILEIGTGTGYNAEIDPDLADHARRALTATGYPVCVITGDGAEGYLPRAPYDRIISTAAVREVPYPWVEQTRPGGTILTPWHTAYHDGALASFTVCPGGVAEGRIVGNVAFMYLRAQRIHASIDEEDCDEATARASHTTVAPYSVAGDYDASLAIGMTVPHCSVITVPDPAAEMTGTLWFVDPTTNSWANLHYHPGTRTYPVHQSGPRNLWDEIETAYHWWRDAGRPGPDRWRITLSAHGQHITLRYPGHDTESSARETSPT
jgi:protein-L-isoaspartate O-methyltransferase